MNGYSIFGGIILEKIIKVMDSRSAAYCILVMKLGISDLLFFVMEKFLMFITPTLTDF